MRMIAAAAEASNDCLCLSIVTVRSARRRGVGELGPDIEPPGRILGRPGQDDDHRGVAAEPVIQVSRVRGPLEAVLRLIREGKGGGLALHHDHKVERAAVRGDELDLAVDPVIHPPVVPQVIHLVHTPGDQRDAAFPGQYLLRDLLPPRRHGIPSNLRPSAARPGRRRALSYQGRA
jgi:hypothetical protein